MRYRVIIAASIFLSMTSAPLISFGAAGGNKVQIISTSSNEPVLNKANLDRVKKYILEQGKRCTYTNMYNNNPCFELTGVRMYLNPDPGPNGHLQWNINCDVNIGDFNTIVFHREDTKDAYRVVEFRNSQMIKITAPDADTGMTDRDLKDFPESAILETLKRIQAKANTSHVIQ